MGWQVLGPLSTQVSTEEIWDTVDPRVAWNPTHALEWHHGTESVSSLTLETVWTRFLNKLSKKQNKKRKTSMYVCLPLVVCFGFVVEGVFVFCLFGQDPADNSLVVFGGAWSCIFALTWQDDLLAEIRLLLHWILPGKGRRKKDEMLEMETGVSWTEKK